MMKSRTTHPTHVDGSGGGGVVGGDVGGRAAADARVARLEGGGGRLAHRPHSMERGSVINLDVRHSASTVLQYALRGGKIVLGIMTISSS